MTCKMVEKMTKDKVDDKVLFGDLCFTRGNMRNLYLDRILSNFILVRTPFLVKIFDNTTIGH